MALNQIAHLQTEVAHTFIRQRNLTPADFILLDQKYNILHFLEIGYEIFHLIDTQGIIDEVDEYIAKQDK